MRLTELAILVGMEQRGRMVFPPCGQTLDSEDVTPEGVNSQRPSTVFCGAECRHVTSPCRHSTSHKPPEDPLYLLAGKDLQACPAPSVLPRGHAHNHREETLEVGWARDEKRGQLHHQDSTSSDPCRVEETRENKDDLAPYCRGRNEDPELHLRNNRDDGEGETEMEDLHCCPKRQMELPGLDTIYSSRLRRKAISITRDTTHPGHSLSDPLPSSKRFRTLKARTNRLRNSFYPRAVASITPLPQNND
ncbi:uncharacterized protein [Hemitrygon akajei]|uniref:uncharacterized protein n=1 Tax=Hemitrygon akajei TaxID=2704970 RepID=UPI003BF94666